MDETVLLGHGSGGTMMKRIIDEVFYEAYGSTELLEGNDAACLEAPQAGERLAYSTDSFVVTPHFFPGGDIGKLAVCGTVNDVATSGAVPKYLSCGFILEEGFPVADLKRICASMAQVAKEAGVHIVTGDTKVVNRATVMAFLSTQVVLVLFLRAWRFRVHSVSLAIKFWYLVPWAIMHYGHGMSRRTFF